MMLGGSHERGEKNDEMAQDSWAAEDPEVNRAQVP
jgi:hypothetical protein